MHYKVQYFCISHPGLRRSMNQDNFICGGQYRVPGEDEPMYPITGYVTEEEPQIIGIFDGMGGEEMGEMASLLAAKTASGIRLGAEPTEDMAKLCDEANVSICDYMKENGISSMGTTAALLAFSGSEITLCNIGDSRIYRLADGKLEQISVDHVSPTVFGRKPPLSQCLGMDPEEYRIDPYLARGAYNIGERYLICSDGLTDMVTEERIEELLKKEPFDEAAENLVEEALEGGGKDNVTVIVLQVEKDKKSFFGRLFGNE